MPQIGADTERSLRAKALLRDAGEHVVPFSDGFSAFLMRYQQNGGDVTTRAAGSNDLTGQTLGQYRVLNLIGRGGMAEVYKGYQPLLDRYVAIKIMLPHHAADAEFVERFQREATAIARLRHANIVQIYDFGVQNGLLYMVMEYISGMTLKSACTSCASTNRPCRAGKCGHPRRTGRRAGLRPQPRPGAPRRQARQRALARGTGARLVRARPDDRLSRRV
jgi:hypothetical protein